MLSLTVNTHRDKSLMGFSICYCRNSICLRLDMLLHYSPQARYVKSARDLSHIELERSDNISSSSKARTYRVNGVDISTEEKREQEYKEKILIFLLSFCLYMGLGLAHFAFDRTNAMLALSGIFKFSTKDITHQDGVFCLKRQLNFTNRFIICR